MFYAGPYIALVTVAVLCPHGGKGVGITGLCQIPAVELIAGAGRVGERVIPVDPERLLTPLMILAFGQTCIVLTQGTDLSLGAQVSFVTVFTVFLAQRGIILEVAMIIAVLCTVLIGAINGTIVAKGNIPPFIATYGMQNIVNSISLLLTAGSSIYFSSFTYRIVTETTILMIPLMVWVAVVVFIIVWIVLKKTKFGTNIHGLGGNKEALVLAGISPVKCLIKTYAFAGFIAGIAGIITLCRVESGQPIVATGWEFQAVAATLLHVEKEGSEQLRLTFEKGELKAVNDEKFDDPIKAIQKVEEIGAAYGIGRDMHVGDTIIGIKGRVGFEAAAPMFLL